MGCRDVSALEVVRNGGYYLAGCLFWAVHACCVCLMSHDGWTEGRRERLGSV